MSHMSLGRFDIAIDRGIFDDLNVSDPNEFTFSEELAAKYLLEGECDYKKLVKMIIDGLFQFELISKDIPIVIVGFSMGSLLAYECVRSLEIDHGIFVSNLISVVGIPLEYFKSSTSRLFVDDSKTPEALMAAYIDDMESFFCLKNTPRIQSSQMILKQAHIGLRR